MVADTFGTLQREGEKNAKFIYIRGNDYLAI